MSELERGTWRRRPDLNRGWRFCRFNGVVTRVVSCWSLVGPAPPFYLVFGPYWTTFGLQSRCSPHPAIVSLSHGRPAVLPSISTAASKSRARITARRPDGSGSACRRSGTTSMSACCRPRPVSSCRSTCAPAAAGTRFTTRTAPRARHPRRGAARACDLGRPVDRHGVQRTSTSTTAAGHPPFSACSRWRNNTGRPSSRTPPKPRCEINVPTYRFLRKYLERRPPVPLTLRQVDPLIRQLTLYRDLIDRKTGDPL